MTDWERNFRIKIRNLVQKASGQRNHWHDIDELVDYVKGEIGRGILSVKGMPNNKKELLKERGM